MHDMQHQDRLRDHDFGLSDTFKGSILVTMKQIYNFILKLLDMLSLGI